MCGGVAAISFCHAAAFVPTSPLGFSASHFSDVSHRRPSAGVCLMAYGKYGDGRSSSRYASSDRSKRQERVGHVVRSELAQIIQAGFPIKKVDHIDDDLRRRINVVNADVSPDLRHARVTVSITGRGETSTVDKRRAYSWLVRSTKMIRHAMAQRLKHMKVCPDLKFVQADVGAAVDVMQLIEKVSDGYKRENVGVFGGLDDSAPLGAEDWEKMEDFDDEDGWVDLDDDEDEWDEDDIEEEDMSDTKSP